MYIRTVGNWPYHHTIPCQADQDSGILYVCIVSMDGPMAVILIKLQLFRFVLIIQFDQRSISSQIQLLTGIQFIFQIIIKSPIHSTVYIYTKERGKIRLSILKPLPCSLKMYQDLGSDCPVHLVPVSMLCCSDQVLVCYRCLIFGEHRGHKCRDEEETRQAILLITIKTYHQSSLSQVFPREEEEEEEGGGGGQNDARYTGECG